MYKMMLEIEFKKDIEFKKTYREISNMIRIFIDKNNKQLKETHYQKIFSYYSFSNPSPFEIDAVFKAGKSYTVELRSLNKEFLDLKNFQGLETPSLLLHSAMGGKEFYRPRGQVRTETPLFMNLRKDIDGDEKMKEKIRENIVFRYLKCGFNTSDDIAHVRNNVVKEIKIHDKKINIPFEKDKTEIIHNCYHVEVLFEDNPIAKEVEKVIYGGGLGKNTSNGFGFIK